MPRRPITQDAGGVGGGAGEQDFDVHVPDPVEPPPSTTGEAAGTDESGLASVASSSGGELKRIASVVAGQGGVPEPEPGPGEAGGGGPQKPGGAGAGRRGSTATGLPTFARPGTREGARFFSVNVGLNRGLPEGTEGIASPTGGGAPQTPDGTDIDELRRALSEQAAKKM